MNEDQAQCAGAETEASFIRFIRLFFRLPVEEAIAHRWASRLGQLIGPKISDLRPETTLSEMLDWADASGVASLDFLVVFEPELRLEFAEFLEDSGRATFREMVEHYAARFRGCATRETSAGPSEVQFP